MIRFIGPLYNLLQHFTDRYLRLDTHEFWPESESCVTNDGQSASLCWNKTPIWGLQPDSTVSQLRGCWCGTLSSDERTGLSFKISASPRQRSHSRVRVPWNSRPYFTASDSRLPFSSVPTTHRVTVEVFDPASTRDNFWPHYTNPELSWGQEYVDLYIHSPIRLHGVVLN
jgi:hypothetical protein